VTDRQENLAFEIAVLISLLLHAAFFGAYQYRGSLAHVPLLKQLVDLILAPSAARTVVDEPAPTITFVERPEPAPEPPRTFMETDESQVNGEQPKDARYYSDKSTVAANPENPTGITGETPYLEGSETRYMSAENVPPKQQTPVMPPAPAASPSLKLPPTASVPQPSSLPSPKTVEGPTVIEEKKLALLGDELAQPPIEPRHVPTPQVAAMTESAASPPMPVVPSSRREIAAIKSRLTASGTSRIGVAAFNVAESPFGVYDKELIKAVQSRWYALIQQNGLYERAGAVTLHFELMDDGTVRGLSVKQNTAGQILALFCEKAIVDSAPFASLPEKLRVLIGNEPRDVNFTFYY
jgi:hypothetical protein